MALGAIPLARELFEIPAGVTFLNCANMGPQLRSVTAAGLAAVPGKATPWTLTSADWFTGAETLRSLAAEVFGTDANAIALVPAASYGIATAAANLPAARGQSIVLLDQEFPSNVYVWQALAKRQGAHIVTALRKPGESWTDALLRSIDSSTVIVSVPHCHWTDGSRIDLERVADRVHAMGSALVIDASQSLGACPLDLDLVRPDFVVSVGYKWLLGPYGLGYLYVSPRWREHGTPLEHSWLNRKGSEDFARLVDYQEGFRPGARRFDMGEGSQFVLGPMAAAALRQILAWSATGIQESLSRLTDHAAEGARESGYSVLPREQRLGHMIGIRMPNGIPATTLRELAAARIYVSVRGDAIRVAPHLYNDAADIDRFLAVLARGA